MYRWKDNYNIKILASEFQEFLFQKNMSISLQKVYSDLLEIELPNTKEELKNVLQQIVDIVNVSYYCDSDAYQAIISCLLKCDKKNIK